MIKELLKLNLGSRDRAIPGFKGMDIDQHAGVDFVGDVSDLSRFDSGSVGEIMASHVLEHFPHTKTLAVLKEWARVLVPGGILYVAVPDFKRTVELYQKHGLIDWVQNFLMGDQGYATAYHYALFDEERLLNLLFAAGFYEASRVAEFPVGHKDDCSHLMFKPGDIPVSLNVVAVR